MKTQTYEDQNVDIVQRTEDSRRDYVRIDEPESEVRKLLRDRKSSSLKKYMWLTSGSPSMWRFFLLEVLTMCLSGLPGAIGIYLRQKFYPLLLQRCGRGVVFGRNVTLRHPHRIRLGDRVMIDDGAVLDGKGEDKTTITIGDDSIVGRHSLLVCKGGTISLAQEVNVSVNCTLISESSLSIGDKSLVAGNCYIIAGGNHGMDVGGVPFVEQPRQQKGGVVIHENCWFGANATVLDGTAIGPHSIVGAASLVVRDVPPQNMVRGVPARIVYVEDAKKPRLAR